MTDLIIIILLALFVLNGFRHGFISEISSIIALLLGLYLAFFFSDVTAEFLTEIVGISGKYLGLVAFVVTLLLVMALVLSLGKAVEKLTETFMLGFFNRLAGGVFGLMKGMLILSLLLMLFNYLKITDHVISKQKRDESRLYENIETFAPFVLKRFRVQDHIKELYPDDEGETNNAAIV